MANGITNPFAQTEASTPFSPDPFQNLANFATRAQAGSRAGEITAIQRALAEQELAGKQAISQRETGLAPLLAAIGNLSSSASSQLLPNLQGVGSIIAPGGGANVLDIASLGGQERRANVASTQAGATETQANIGNRLAFDPSGLPTLATDARAPLRVEVARAEAGLKPTGQIVEKELIIRKKDGTTVTPIVTRTTTTKQFGTDVDVSGQTVEQPIEIQVAREAIKQLPAGIEFNDNFPITELALPSGATGFFMVVKDGGKDKRAFFDSNGTLIGIQ